MEAVSPCASATAWTRAMQSLGPRRPTEHETRECAHAITSTGNNVFEPIAEVAATEQVDRSTTIRIRTVAKDGALATLAASKPGVGARLRDYELEQAKAKAEAARLSEACKELAVRLTLVVGKGGCAEWPRPTPRRSGHQGQLVGPGRPSSLRRVLSLADKYLRPLPKPASRGGVSSRTGWSSTRPTASGSTTSNADVGS